MEPIRRKETFTVLVGKVPVGGDHPIVVQSMTNTDTADVEATVNQIVQLVEAGSELVRITVNNRPSAAAVVEIRKRLLDRGVDVPLIGDFHFNGHILLREFPQCAQTLDKYRINPGNVGKGEKKDPQFRQICEIARDNGKPVRIGVNAGSLDQDLVVLKMQENTDRNLGLSSEEILIECMIQSALQSTQKALEFGLREDQIVISCKVSNPQSVIAVYSRLAELTRQPLHVGLTEAGMGIKGIVASTAALAVLLQRGIGDTIRVSLTPEPEGDRTREVRVAREILQSLGIRSFKPSVTACPGCGRTTSTVFQRLAENVESYLEKAMPRWKEQYPGVEELKVAVMGCIVNGPGESKAADIGISLPGTGEEPFCPVYVDGRKFSTLHGDYEQLSREFIQIIDDYVAKKFCKEGREDSTVSAH